MTDPLQDKGLYNDLLSELKALRGEVAELRRAFAAPTTPSMSVEEAAAYLGCGRKTIFRYLSSKTLTKARRHGRRSMVSRASVEALAAPEGTKSPPPRKERALTPQRPFNAEAELARLEELLLEPKKSSSRVIKGPRRPI